MVERFRKRYSLSLIHRETTSPNHSGISLMAFRMAVKNKKTKQQKREMLAKM